MLLDELIKSGLRNVPIYFSDLKCVYWSLGHSNTHLRHHAKNSGTPDEDQDALQSTMIFSNILPDTWGKLVGAADWVQIQVSQQKGNQKNKNLPFKFITPDKLLTLLLHQSIQKGKSKRSLCFNLINIYLPRHRERLC